MLLHIQPDLIWYKSIWFLSIGTLAISVYIAIMLYRRAKRLATDQKTLTQLVDEKTREIRQQNEALEKNNRIKTRLISIISHDIVTPLRFLHITGKNMLENNDTISDVMRDEVLAEMVTTARELELLTTNILNWIKYQNENRALLREPFDLHVIIGQIFGLVNGMARQKNIVLTNDVPQGFIIEQHIEPLKIVLYNLVINALNFMERGHITINSRQLRNGLLIEVKDEGLGMTEEQINNILSDRFVISSANVDGKRGNGLGYLIIKDLLKLLNGRFTIKSAPNKGTSIKLFFPEEQGVSKIKSARLAGTLANNGRHMGVEPTTFGTTIQRSNQLS